MLLEVQVLVTKKETSLRKPLCINLGWNELFNVAHHVSRDHPCVKFFWCYVAQFHRHFF